MIFLIKADWEINGDDSDHELWQVEAENMTEAEKKLARLWFLSWGKLDGYTEEEMFDAIKERHVPLLQGRYRGAAPHLEITELGDVSDMDAEIAEWEKERV